MTRDSTASRRTPVLVALLLVVVAAVAVVTAVAIARGGGQGIDRAATAGPSRTPAPEATLPAPAALATAAPSSPPVRICGDTELLQGPAQPPPGATTVPAGDNTELMFDLRAPGRTFWFAPGVHTLEQTEFGQIIAGDGSTFVGAPGAILDGGNRNLYAFTGTASGVTIEHLTVRNFGTGRSNNDAGVVNHDRGQNWTIRFNTFTANDGAAVMLGSGNVLTQNCLKDNGQYGFSAVPGEEDVVRSVTVDRNEIAGNNTDDWEALRSGCGCTGGGKFWTVEGATVTNNYVHDNRGTGLWADNDNRGMLFQGNYIANNDKHGLHYEVSYNFAIRKNTFIRNDLVEGAEYSSRADKFPSGAIYISESGGDSRAGTTFTTSEITGNLFQDNWDGIVLWENADRFCRPGEEFDTTNGCPFFDKTWGKRYKTQNIRITGNEFRFDRAAVKCGELCGRQAVFSNFGTVPDNSPYKGEKIQDAITFKQNNVWADNTYVGPWRFVAHDLDVSLDAAGWQQAPYGQDTSSTFR